MQVNYMPYSEKQHDDENAMMSSIDGEYDTLQLHTFSLISRYSGPREGTMHTPFLFPLVECIVEFLQDKELRTNAFSAFI